MVLILARCLPWYNQLVKPASQSEDLATRVFNNSWFGICWVVFLGILVTKLWWVRNMFLVWWVYGRDAYFRDGVRVLPGKPIRFSTGELAPQWPDIVTGFGFFLVVVFGVSLLVIFGLRLYERFRKRSSIPA